MARTGETYTAARAALEDPAYDAARREQERLVARFEPGRVYTEPEVNEVLLGVHDDFAYPRRGPAGCPGSWRVPADPYVAGRRRA